jgi:hypothetical protein
VRIAELREFLNSLPSWFDDRPIFYREVVVEDDMMIAEDMPVDVITISDDKTELLMMSRQTDDKIAEYKNSIDSKEPS